MHAPCAGGTDTQGRSNHDRVCWAKKLLEEQHGLSCWLDEEQMQGDINQQMTKGIDSVVVVVVFITRRYVTKVAGEGAAGDDDNCAPLACCCPCCADAGSAYPLCCGQWV